MRLQNILTEFLYVVFLHTWAFITAVDTADAGMDIRVGSIDHFDRMSRFFRAPDKIVRQHIGRTMLIRTSFQNYDLHLHASNLTGLLLSSHLL